MRSLVSDLETSRKAANILEAGGNNCENLVTSRRVTSTINMRSGKQVSAIILDKLTCMSAEEERAFLKAHLCCDS